MRGPAIALCLLLGGCAGFSERLETAADATTEAYRSVLDERAQSHWVVFQGALRLLCADGVSAIYRVHGAERGQQIVDRCKEIALQETETAADALGFQTETVNPTLTE